MVTLAPEVAWPTTVRNSPDATCGTTAASSPDPVDGGEEEVRGD
jgi:hypothetical protein